MARCNRLPVVPLELVRRTYFPELTPNAEARAIATENPLDNVKRPKVAA
jgi:hypothetical protein